MKSNLKIRITAALCALILPFLISCRDKKDEPCTITFSWWGNDDRAKYTLAGIEEFSRLYPHITVTPEYGPWSGYEDAFEKKFSEGTNTDVMQINADWLYKYSKDGNGFYDLNKLDDYIDYYNFTLSDLESGSIKGKLNAIPIAFNTIIPIYDESILKANGISIPNSWDDLFAAGKKLKAKNLYLLGINAKHLFLLSIAWFEQTHSKKVFSADQTFAISDSEYAELVDFARRMIREHVIHPDVNSFTASAFKSKKLAGAIAWCNEASTLSAMIESIGGQAVLGNFITAADAKESGWYVKPVSMYAIKKDCPHPKEAAIFINFLLNNPEMALLQKCDKGVPASNTSLTTLMEHKQLQTLQYNSLMKIRFNKSSIQSMLPVMENKAVIAQFTLSL